METYFASPTRSDSNEISDEISQVHTNPILGALIDISNDLFVIINKNRQIVAANNAFIKVLGLSNIREITGKRLGESLHCEHAFSKPNGCGTTPDCTTCGAAIAIAAAQDSQKPFNNTCIIHTDNNGTPTDMMFNIKTNYYTVKDNEYLLIFLRDITREQELAALERVFFHDVNNILSSLNIAVEIAAKEDEKSDVLSIIKRCSTRLSKEVEMQQYLTQGLTENYILRIEEISVNFILSEINQLISVHHSSDGKFFRVTPEKNDLQIHSDISIVMKVLVNMCLNALEASHSGDKVSLWHTSNNDGSHTFSVNNITVIPDEDRSRVFQRNFSTKGESGRGLGTYSMKLFGEKILGGKIGFTTSLEHGTTFSFTIPPSNNNLLLEQYNMLL